MTTILTVVCSMESVFYFLEGQGHPFVKKRLMNMAQGRAKESSLTLDSRTVSPSSVAKQTARIWSSAGGRREAMPVDTVLQKKGLMHVSLPVFCIMDAHTCEPFFVRPPEGLWRG